MSHNGFKSGACLWSLFSPPTVGGFCLSEWLTAVMIWFLQLSAWTPGEETVDWSAHQCRHCSPRPHQGAFWVFFDYVKCYCSSEVGFNSLVYKTNRIDRKLSLMSNLLKSVLSKSLFSSLKANLDVKMRLCCDNREKIHRIYCRCVQIIYIFLITSLP